MTKELTDLLEKALNATHMWGMTECAAMGGSAMGLFLKEHEDQAKEAHRAVVDAIDRLEDRARISHEMADGRLNVMERQQKEIRGHLETIEALRLRIEELEEDLRIAKAELSDKTEDFESLEHNFERVLREKDELKAPRPCSTPMCAGVISCRCQLCGATR